MLTTAKKGKGDRDREKGNKAGEGSKEKGTHLKSIFFVQTPLTIPLASIKNVALPVRWKEEERDIRVGIEDA